MNDNFNEHTINARGKNAIRQLRRRDTSEAFFDSKWGGSRTTRPTIFKFRLNEELPHCASASATLFYQQNEIETELGTVTVHDPTGQVSQATGSGFAPVGWVGTCYRENREFHIIEIGPGCEENSGSGSGNNCIDIVTDIQVVGCNLEITTRNLCFPNNVTIGDAQTETIDVPCCCDSGSCSGCASGSDEGSESQIACTCTGDVDDSLNADEIFSWIAFPDFMCKGSEYTVVFKDFGTHTNTTDPVLVDIFVVGAEVTITDDAGGSVSYPSTNEAVIDFGTTSDRELSISFSLSLGSETCLDVNIEGGTFPDFSTTQLEYDATS